jgi:hypothetical protein
MHHQSENWLFEANDDGMDIESLVQDDEPDKRLPIYLRDDKLTVTDCLDEFEDKYDVIPFSVIFAKDQNLDESKDYQQEQLYLEEDNYDDLRQDQEDDESNLTEVNLYDYFHLRESDD